MRELFSWLAFVIAAIISTSCSLVGPRGPLIYSDDSKIASTRAKQIIEAVKNEDRDALRSVFSQKALDDTEDFDGGTDSFFDFIQGNIMSWESDFVSGNESIQYGKRTRINRFNISIKTDIDDYVLYVIDYFVDTIDPDNEGVNMLLVRTSEYTENLGMWQQSMISGILIPEAE